MLVAGFALALSGCARPITGFSFDSNGTPVGLHSDRSVAPSGQGEFLTPAKGATRTTLLYTLDRPQTVTTSARDFYLTYSAGGGPLELQLTMRSSRKGDRVESSIRLPLPVSAAADGAPAPDASKAAGTSSAAPELRYLLPLSAGSRILAFRVTTNSRKAEIRIRDAGLTGDYRGVRFARGLTSIRSGFSLDSGAGSDAKTTISFPRLVADLGGAQAQVVLTYTYARAPGVVQLTASGSSNQSRRYSINLRPGTHRLYLYTASCGFTPVEVTISSGNRGFSVDSLEVHRFPTPRNPDSLKGSTTPIPADLGAILSYNPKWWRQKNYELFSWSLIPSVLVIEYRSYEVQAAYMKRIAYFVEKWGYAGKLWTNAQLAGRIGWNAHDYRPEDLAHFFTKAEEEHFALDPQEEHLKAILLANGLLRREGGAYSAGKGAILTFAHVGSYWLRWLLLTHESFHGIFFTHPAYRRAVFSIWDHTNPEERWLFRNVFLAYEGYDIGDIYLVKDEFQAYLMEQPVDRTEAYFDAALARRMKVMRVSPSSPPALYFKSHPEMFRNSAERVEKAVEEAAGVTAGENVGLVPD